MFTRLILGAIAAAALVTSVVQAADPSGKTASLVSVLQSEAGVFEKARACQQLGEIGDRDAVPALAALLTDPHLAAYARSGLEGIPGPSAAAALRDAAGKLTGPLLIGVVNSLGALRDPQAVRLLTRIAGDPGSDAANQALMALGNIGSPDAIRFLGQTLATAPDPLRAEAAVACLLAADRQRTAGNLDGAVALYDAVRNAKVPVACRVGATRGAILARKTGRAPFLLEQLRSDELAIRNAALMTIRDLPDDDALAAALNAELTRAQPELQGQLLLALVDCHNAQSIPAIATLADSSNPQLRRTALMVLGKFGADAAPVLLAALRKDLAAEDKAVVLGGLKGMKGTAVDDLLLESLRAGGPPTLRADLVRLLDSRGVAQAGGEILRQATGPDKEVSLVALAALKSLAGARDLPALIALLKSCRDDEIREAAESAAVGVCDRSGDGTPAAETILSELKRAADPAEKNSWIRILAALGYAPALPAIAVAVQDPAAAVAENAVRQLGRWPDPAPIETLLTTLNAGAGLNLRKVALTAVIDLAATATDDAQRPETTIVQWLRQANAAAQSVADKRRILGVAGRLKTLESLRLLAPCLDDPQLRTEAAAGVVQLAPALAKGPGSSELKTALDKIATTVSNPDLRTRAIELAKTIPAPGATVNLFDGSTLAGWEGDTNVWRVRDGVIVGGSLQGNPRNEFLATVRSYTNFVLRLEYRLVGTEGFVNSGVQVRSVCVTDPPNEMSGYQADIGAGYSGCLYDESRRNTILAKAAEEVVKRLENANDWNRYEVRCEGPHIEIRLNGEKTVDYTETDTAIPHAGKIALQIHGGNKAEVSFRNLTLEELPGS